MTNQTPPLSLPDPSPHSWDTGTGPYEAAAVDQSFPMAPLSPPVPTESEMINFRQMFERAANAIVQASELTEKVAELVRTVDALKADVDTARTQNAWLDEQVGRLRKERDIAVSERLVVQSERDDLRASLEQNAIHFEEVMRQRNAAQEQFAAEHEHLIMTKDELADTHVKWQALVAELAQVRGEMDVAISNVEGYRVRVNELISMRNEALDQKEWAEGATAVVQRNRDEVLAERDSAQAEAKGAWQASRDREAERDEAINSLNAIKARLASTVADLSTLCA